MEIKLIASTGRAKGQAVEIRAAKFFIGRHDNCQIRPDLDELAGIHALIEQRADGVHLRDFGALGGTGINDRVIFLRETEVFDGDLIQIGPMVLTLSMKGKGEDHHETLREVPEGWPYLEGVVMSSTTTAPADHPSVERALPVAQTSDEVAATPKMPSRLSDFLARETAAAVTSAVLEVPAPAVDPPAPRPSGRPIVARSRVLRAIQCEKIDGVTVVTLLNPDLKEEETVSPVRYELRILLDEDEIPRKTVIDLGQTEFLSSRAVGVLLAHYQALDRQGAAMRVCRVSPKIQPVIDQMRLSRLVEIFATLEEAIETPWD